MHTIAMMITALSWRDTQVIIIKTTGIYEQKMFSYRASNAACNYDRVRFRRLENDSRLRNRRRKEVGAVHYAHYHVWDPGTNVDYTVAEEFTIMGSVLKIKSLTDIATLYKLIIS